MVLQRPLGVHMHIVLSPDSFDVSTVNAQQTRQHLVSWYVSVTKTSTRIEPHVIICRPVHTTSFVYVSLYSCYTRVVAKGSAQLRLPLASAWNLHARSLFATVALDNHVWDPCQDWRKSPSLRPLALLSSALLPSTPCKRPKELKDLHAQGSQLVQDEYIYEY